MSDETRYSRQILIPEWNQEKMENSCVLIAGVGAIGSYVGTILASAGVKKLILIDMDKIEVSNLNRQLLYTDNDVGQYKAEVAAKKLEKLNPTLAITFYNKKMEEVPKSVYESSTVIIACLDTFIGRRWINSMAVNLKKSLVLGGMFAFLGDVQVVIPFETPCFECQPLVSEEELAQACTPIGEERRKRQEEEHAEEAKLPAVSTLSAIIGGLMAQEALKLIQGIGKPIENYLFYDGLNNAFTDLKLARNKECPNCGELYNLQQVQFVVSENEPIGAIKTRLALTYGLSEPEIMVQGYFLESEKTLSNYNIKEESLAFVMDKNLAAPIKLLFYFKNG